MPVDASIFNQNKTYQDYLQAKQEFDARNALAMAQAKKAMIPDLDELGQRAYLKAANGIDLNPSEQAALSYIDQKSQTFGFNPATGRLEQKPSLLQRIGMSPQGAPTPSTPAAQPTFNPQSPFAKAMGGTPQVGTGDPLADMGITSPLPIPNTINSLSPKAGQLLSEEQIKAGQKRVTDLQSAAQNASAASQAAELMKNLQPDLGYTGTGAGITSWIDKGLTGIGLGGLISGEPSSRETFQSQGVKAWVEASQPMKGALSDREGAKLDAAVPTLTTTPDGIKKMTTITQLMGERAQEKSQFYEQYFSQNGTLNGADAIWKEYADKNPILTDDVLGIKKIKKGMTKEQFNNQQKLTPAEQEELNQLRARFGK